MMPAAGRPRSVEGEMPSSDSPTFNDFVVDMRVAALLAGHVRRRVVTRVFGLPPEDQTFLVSLAVLGGAAGVLAGFASRPLPRPSGTDLVIGGALVNTGLRGIAGPPSAGVPLAGVLIAFALLSHGIRPTLARSAHGIGQLEHDARTAFRTFLGELPRPSSRASA
jgi:hypothetical protein